MVIMYYSIKKYQKAIYLTLISDYELAFIII